MADSRDLLLESARSLLSLQHFERRPMSALIDESMCTRMNEGGMIQSRASARARDPPNARKPRAAMIHIAPQRSIR
jgi:hypothetical protein